MKLTDLTHIASGKIRDMYAVGDDHLLLVSSDRISAFDYVLRTAVPDKGRILTAMAAWWFNKVGEIAPHHFVSTDDPRIPTEVAGRAMLCRRLRMIPIECVARGYLAGSATKDYLATGAVCGITLPPGLTESSQFPQPLFTPATKAQLGEHDENVTFDAVTTAVGSATAVQLREITLNVYRWGSEVAKSRGFILADTKLELGWDEHGVLTIGDELLTPDSSRFWQADSWRPGVSQPPFDKQYVRNWLTKESGWDQRSEPPPLPDKVVNAIRSRYVEAYEQLTGLLFSDWPG